MSGIRFRGQQSFRGLQEAVDSILADSEDEEIDMVIVPPNPSKLTDEEEGVEDDMTTSALPQDIPLSRHQWSNIMVIILLNNSSGESQFVTATKTGLRLVLQATAIHLVYIPENPRLNLQIHWAPVETVKRWCPRKHEKTDVVIPNLFQNYNKGMGGVDELDQSISLYRIAVHGKKW